MTGLYTDNTYISQSAMQAYLTTQNLGLYETYSAATAQFYTLGNSFPVITDATNVEQYTFYDDYAWAAWFGFPTAKANTYDGQFPAASNSSYPYPQALTQNKQTLGMPTGTWNRIINSTHSGIIVENFYDDKDRKSVV